MCHFAADDSTDWFSMQWLLWLMFIWIIDWHKALICLIDFYIFIWFDWITVIWWPLIEIKYLMFVGGQLIVFFVEFCFIFFFILVFSSFYFIIWFSHFSSTTLAEAHSLCLSMHIFFSTIYEITIKMFVNDNTHLLVASKAIKIIWFLLINYLIICMIESLFIE